MTGDGGLKLLSDERFARFFQFTAERTVPVPGTLLQRTRYDTATPEPFSTRRRGAG